MIGFFQTQLLRARKQAESNCKANKQANVCVGGALTAYDAGSLYGHNIDARKRKEKRKKKSLQLSSCFPLS